MKTLWRMILQFCRNRRKRLWVQGLGALLRPSVPEGVHLVRIGNQAGDGGYLVGCGLSEYSVLLSYGILDDVSFEEDFSRRWPLCKIHLFDHTIPCAPASERPMIFHQVGVGAEDVFPFGTLQKHWEVFGNRENRIFLKMDVEGAEYDSLLSTPKLVLEAIDQLVLELHDVEWWNTNVLRLLKRLKEVFVVVHVHANNSGGAVDVEGVLVPKVLEVTFMNRHRYAGFKLVNVPNMFDVANDARFPELGLEGLLS
jgi:hypothetical protein